MIWYYFNLNKLKSSFIRLKERKATYLKLKRACFTYSAVFNFNIEILLNYFKHLTNLDRRKKKKKKKGLRTNWLFGHSTMASYHVGKSKMSTSFYYRYFLFFFSIKKKNHLISYIIFLIMNFTIDCILNFNFIKNTITWFLFVKNSFYI